MPSRIPKQPSPATPWINASCPTTERTYKFRLELHRRGGCVHVRMHNESPSSPGKSYIVRNTRPGFFSFIEAARALLRASRWERIAYAGTHPWRATWNTASVDYPLRMTHAHTVTLHLDIVVNPRMGRPVALAHADAREAAGKGRGGVRTGVSQARANRRNELLAATSDMQNRLHPLLEKINVRHLTGYTAEEKRQLLQLLAEVQYAIGTLRDVVFNNKFNYKTPSPTDTSAPTPMQGDPSTQVEFNPEEF